MRLEVGRCHKTLSRVNKANFSAVVEASALLLRIYITITRNVHYSADCMIIMGRMFKMKHLSKRSFFRRNEPTFTTKFSILPTLVLMMVINGTIQLCQVPADYFWIARIDFSFCHSIGLPHNSYIADDAKQIAIKFRDSK